MAKENWRADDGEACERLKGGPATEIEDNFPGCFRADDKSDIFPGCAQETQ